MDRPRGSGGQSKSDRNKRKTPLTDRRSTTTLTEGGRSGTPYDTGKTFEAVARLVEQDQNRDRPGSVRNSAIVEARRCLPSGRPCVHIRSLNQSDNSQSQARQTCSRCYSQSRTSTDGDSSVCARPSRSFNPGRLIPSPGGQTGLCIKERPVAQSRQRKVRAVDNLRNLAIPAHGFAAVEMGDQLPYPQVPRLRAGRPPSSPSQCLTRPKGLRCWCWYPHG